MKVYKFNQRDQNPTW